MNTLRKNLVATLALLLMATAAVQAVPAWPGKLKLRRADGTTTTAYLRGDEHHHWFETEQGEIIGQSHPIHSTHPAHIARQPHHLPFPTTGEVHGLVLLVEFSDVHFQTDHTQAVFQGLLNAEGYSGFGAQGSARDYFVAQSSGRFTPQFDVVGPIRLSQPMSYYGADDDYGTDAHAGIMVQEACQQAHDVLGTDFGQYDFNHDGVLDYVYIIYAGYGQNYGADANTVWPHTASLPDWGIDLVLDGLTVSRYACGCELKYTQGTQLEGIGTFCHEFGHVLGLPDFYDTRHQNSMRLGQWDIMDQGCYLNESRTPCAYSAFERYSLGWLEFTDLDEPSDLVQLPELTTTNTAYRIRTSRPDEYFTLENRQQQGWDTYQPASGLLIAHVDYDQAAWDANTVNNGTDQRYQLMAADGVVSSATYATDLFPSAGNDRFTDTSKPSMLMRDGTPTGKPIIKIRDVGGVITFRFMQQPLSRPEAPVVSQLTATTLTASWQPVDGAMGYRLTARQQLTADENPIVADETFAAMTEGSADSPDEAEMGTVLDSYLAQEGWTGNDLHQAGGRLSMGAGSTLQSPLLDLSAADGRFTVALLAEAGAEVKLTITAARNSGRELSSTNLTLAPGSETTLLAPLTDGIGRTRVTIAVAEGQLLLSRLRIVKDHVGEADAWAEAAQTVSTDVADATTATLTGLLPQKTYALTLTALADDDDLHSQPSPEVIVTMPQQTDGIIAPQHPATATAAGRLYDLQGRPVGAPRPGIYVVRQADGRTLRMVKR